jgi:hypothetical protein
MPDVTGQCPMCESELVVTHLRCHECGTGLEGNFRLTKFDRLAREQLRFVDVFLKNRGVIRDVERELNISYPPVRSRLDEVIRALGYDGSGETAEAPDSTTGPPPAPAAPDPERRRHILSRVEAGELTADEAVHMLRGENEQ